MSVMGGVVGWSLSYLDWILYIYVLHPEAQIARYVQHQIKRKQVRLAIDTLRKRQEELTKLTTRGFLFQVIWVGLALFTLTSVSSYFARALVMGLGLKVLLTEWREYLTDKRRLKQWLFWQIKREVSDEELKWYLYVMTGLMIGFVWLFL